MIDIKGIGSEGAIVNLILSAFIAWHIFIKPRLMKRESKDRRKADESQVRKSNPESMPGKSEACQKQRDALTKLGEGLGNLKELFEKLDRRNREDHQKFFDKLERKKNRNLSIVNKGER